VKKTWLVATTTYRRRIRSGMFLILTFGLPVLMVVAGGIAVLSELSGNLGAVGYVDQTGQLQPVSEVPIEGKVLQLTSFPDVAAARQAIQRGDITGFLLIPQGYLQGDIPTYYGQQQASAVLELGLTHFLRRALLPNASAQTLARLDDPATITFVALSSGAEVNQGPALIIRFALPAALAILFGFAVMTGISQMGSAIVREKEQRAMEMVITSLSPTELVAGKVMGMTLLSLTQFGIWILGGGIAAAVALIGKVQLRELVIPWVTLGWGFLLVVPTYFLYAVLASGLGIIAGDRQQAQQLAGALGLIGLSPLYVLTALLNAPGGSFAVALTLFPLTSPMIALIRMVLTEVPTWQLAAAFGIIVLSLLGSIWAVSRIFRAAMLIYGQTLRPREIWQALRGA
jgi:ABC-2 type transport system permease protein